MPENNPKTLSGVFAHLTYRQNHDGKNGLGRWSSTAKIELPLPVGLNTIERTYGETIVDENTRVVGTIAPTGWQVPIGGVSAQVYALMGRIDIGIDLVLSVEIGFKQVMRAARLEMIKRYKGNNFSGFYDAVKAFTDIIPEFSAEGRIGFSMGISQGGRGYVRLSTFRGLALKLKLPNGVKLEMTDGDAKGRHWQVTLGNLSGHMPAGFLS